MLQQGPNPRHLETFQAPYLSRKAGTEEIRLSLYPSFALPLVLSRAPLPFLQVQCALAVEGGICSSDVLLCACDVPATIRDLSVNAMTQTAFKQLSRVQQSTAAGCCGSSSPRLGGLMENGSKSFNSPLRSII